MICPVAKREAKLVSNPGLYDFKALVWEVGFRLPCHSYVHILYNPWDCEVARICYHFIAQLILRKRA
jgi:hypothetical protein